MCVSNPKRVWTKEQTIHTVESYEKVGSELVLEQLQSFLDCPKEDASSPSLGKEKVLLSVTQSPLWKQSRLNRNSIQKTSSWRVSQHSQGSQMTSAEWDRAFRIPGMHFHSEESKGCNFCNSSDVAAAADCQNFYSCYTLLSGTHQAFKINHMTSFICFFLPISALTFSR